MVRGYYGLLAAALLAALIGQCILTASEGRSLANTFSFFTIQSNVLVLVSSALIAWRPAELTGAWWRILRLAALVGITVTGIVYVLFLARSIHLTGLASVYNQMFHHASPFLSLVGFLVIEPKQRFVWRDYAFLAWPVLWLVYTMVRGAYFHPQFTGFTPKPSDYPYPFLDVTEVPMTEVVGSIAFVFVLLVVIGGGYILGDRAKPFRLRSPG
ncbi:hypothetical protein MTES_0208 [Microbacterium testaceum StLB037]|uniref:Pr6Pr family membrane protein n=1 Tax=Microbacterium testaceum (strain StLB037) TaxID=979556 RepID=E8N8W3_MICTS|nr:hypothetical protein MTES_0208 [Microbacterium testaceum StLB037]